LIDTHSHVLPGIDDGSKSIEESIELCRIAASDGISTTVCTPHINFRYENGRGSIEQAFDALREAVEREGIPLELVKGAEVHMSPDILARVRERDLVTYNDNGRYLLLEFPFQRILTGEEEMVYRLRLASVVPVIAHPERIEYFMDNPDRLLQLVRQGALGQVTGGSILGLFGERPQRAAMTMIERDLVHVIASDAHDTKYRKPVLADAARAVEERFGAAKAKAMVLDTPRALVRGDDVDVPEPVERPQRGLGFFSLFSRRGGS